MNKKLLLIGCIAALSISMTACGNSSSSSNTDSSTSSTVISDKSATDESKTEEDVTTSDASSEEVDTTSAKDVMNKIIATVSENKNCAMTAEASMSAKFKMTIDGSSMNQDMSSTVNVDAKSTNKGIYSKAKEVKDNNDGTSKITEKESYIVNDSKTTYTSEDGGKTWIKNTDDVDFSKLVDMGNIFADDNAFDDATISTEDDKFIIDVDLSKVQQLTEGLSKNFNDDAGFTGILEIVADKDYYPISIEMKDIQFDTESMEESMKAMTVDSDGSSGESVDADVDIDLNLAFKANYSDWNTISDEDVTPSEDIVKNAIVNDTTTINDTTTDSISE